MQFGMFLTCVSFLLLVLAAAPPARVGQGGPENQGRMYFGMFVFEISLLAFKHQCEKGKPPTGVCYKIFLKNPAG